MNRRERAIATAELEMGLTDFWHDVDTNWGRNAGERFTQQCDMFSQRLENAGITHFAEEYIGTHVSGIFTRDGRVPNDMLPFFDAHLDFGKY